MSSTANSLLRTSKYLLTLFAACVLLWGSLFAYQRYLQFQVRKETSIRTAHGIDSLQKITLGGTAQWILIRGQDTSKPVLLFLHGGPGSPLFTYARDIGAITKLEEQFVMVYWEQRGTGKSYFPSLAAESMTIDQIVADTHELTNYLRERFNVPKIFLAGRSWGSLIGILAAGRDPQFYHAYIGIGQVICPLESDRIAHHYTLETAASMHDKKALHELSALSGPPFHYRELLVQRKWLTKFYDSMMEGKFQIKVTNHRRMLLSTPEYSLFDIIRMGMDPYFSIKCLWNEEYYRINLLEQLPRLELPVFFIAGRHDYFSPSCLVARYFQKVDAPGGKYFHWFERSGHKPEREEPGKFAEVMVNEVLVRALDHPDQSVSARVQNR